ncbi:hypothetical protein KC360_g3425 [Hortaea werneckii]|nr:hypothetical protein KC361_g3526 [Hortaea werneckii]KAI6885738.1 hypothetical protein KC325_g3327 [Hortaea werneckii]KAI6995218.1 hypothetical protein KC359_g4223 [Hortaea werneckii]KAI7175804.1 hypothetical protein KC360_g3425 [Hortaea werneckii]KAI7511629.1 hypothetical protein KC347_g3194 [Hortaea werneckii]
MEATMGDNYYYVTATGPVFAGQGIDLHGSPRRMTFPAPLQGGDVELNNPVDGPNDGFEFQCECPDIDAENSQYVSQPFAYQISGNDMADSTNDLSQSFSSADYYEGAESYDLLQDEQNPEATWVEGPPGNVPFADASGFDMPAFDNSFLGPFNCEPEFDWQQNQTVAEAAPQLDFLQIPNRDQRAQRRAQLLAQMQQISQELIELEALDAA